MYIINSNSYNPYFNLATEEYLFKNKQADYFILYRNEPSIIVGKHQNTYGEINYPDAYINKIPVIRRLSGGGTVYHDLGNINFSYILSKKSKNLVDFKKHIDPIFKFLKEMGINAKYSDRNDLFIEQNKISGNAEHLFKNRVLHHGTLLYNSNLNNLSKYLKVNLNNFKSRAIASTRSKVTNISDYLELKINIEDFCAQLIQKFQFDNKTAKIYQLSNSDIKNINEIVSTKYNTWEWNFAYSPSFKFSKKIVINDISVFISFEIKNGIIQKINSYSGLNHNLVNSLAGEKYEYDNIRKIIQQLKLDIKLLDLLF